MTVELLSIKYKYIKTVQTKWKMVNTEELLSIKKKHTKKNRLNGIMVYDSEIVVH